MNVATRPGRTFTFDRWASVEILGEVPDFVVANSGHYVVLVEVVRPFATTIAGLGSVRFSRGFYANVGTMKRGLVGRVARHLTRDKKLGNWHADRLTTAADARAIGAVMVPWPVWTEHTLSAAVGERLTLSTPIPGFSSADCRAGCEAHLWFSSSPLSLDDVAQAVDGVRVVRVA